MDQVVDPLHVADRESSATVDFLQTLGYKLRHGLPTHLSPPFHSIGSSSQPSPMMLMT